MHIEKVLRALSQNILKYNLMKYHSLKISGYSVSVTHECAIKEMNGFLKYDCGTYRKYLKCVHSEEYYELVRNTGYTIGSCSNDPHFYMVCGTEYQGKITNSELLCEKFFCKHPNRYLDTIAPGAMVRERVCNGKYDCKNTLLDEEGCSEKDLKSCDNVCSTLGKNNKVNSCQDESDCNGYKYGLNCMMKVNYGDNKFVSDKFAGDKLAGDKFAGDKLAGDKYVEKYVEKYIDIPKICDMYKDCSGGEDEKNCEDTSNTTDYLCQHYSTGRIVPIHNYTRCGVLRSDFGGNRLRIDSSYCSNFHDQTNCSDAARVGGICEVGGFMTRISIYMVCHYSARRRDDLCDDGMETKCDHMSALCYEHKHKMCDGKFDCLDKTDEDIRLCKSSSLTERKCTRRFGNAGNIPIRLTWLHDGIKDCVDGEDETEDWPKCGEPGTSRERFVTNNKNCKNVFLCSQSDNKYIEYKNLCDGMDSCPLEVESKVCSSARNVPKVQTQAMKFDSDGERDLKILSPLCVRGMEEFRRRFNKPCVSENFRYPNHDIFGFNTKTKIIIPSETKNCDHLFGESYLYTSCLNRCENSSCPLRNPPRYEFCQDQFSGGRRIGTLANNSYLTFLKKSPRGVYSNNFFVCRSNMTCLDYSKVCDLVDDCKDGSDEEGCTNHFKCEETGHYIPVVKVCDGKFDCLDLSDECNERCKRQILQQPFLKVSSFGIGGTALLSNFIIIVKQLVKLKSCRTSVALVNKSLVIMIAFGDILVGGYLFALAVVDYAVFGDDYCRIQTKWLSSTECSTMGIISTIGSQVSLFSMTGLSLVRMHGISTSMRIPGEITKKKITSLVSAVVFIIAGSAAIAASPSVEGFEDNFINGFRYSKELKIFVGFTDKATGSDIVEAYHGRMKNRSLSWKMTNELLDGMFSHDTGHEDLTLEKSRVGFYGNDGVCLFKYFVHPDDPQLTFVWSTLTLVAECS